MNPYARFLGSADPVQTMEATAGRLRALLDALGADGVERAPAPGKWCAREIVCHLADCELVFGFRLRQTLAEPGHVIQPFDQEKWAVRYAAFTAPEALGVFTSVRAWNTALVRAVPAEAFSTIVTHPERGNMTFQTIVETIAGHDLNHIRQLEAMTA
jgi:hypothetical protein